MPRGKKCRGCGVASSDEHPPIAGDGRPFYWVSSTLCSRCALVVKVETDIIGLAEAARMLRTSQEKVAELADRGQVQRARGVASPALWLKSVLDYQARQKEEAQPTDAKS